LQQGTDWGKWIHSFFAFIKSFFVRQPKVKVSYRKSAKAKSQSKSTSSQSATAKSVDSTSQEEIDAILDKISQFGYESLSKEEKQKLFNASKH
jgi:hypothetical protein